MKVTVHVTDKTLVSWLDGRTEGHKERSKGESSRERGCKGKNEASKCKWQKGQMEGKTTKRQLRVTDKLSGARWVTHQPETQTNWLMLNLIKWLTVEALWTIHKTLKWNPPSSSISPCWPSLTLLCCPPLPSSLHSTCSTWPYLALTDWLPLFQCLFIEFLNNGNADG